MTTLVDQQALSRLDDDEDAEAGAARTTWGTVDRLMERSATFRRNIGVVFDVAVPAKERQSALELLRVRLEADPARQLIRAARNRESGGTWVDEFSIQISILSQRTFDWFTPVHSRHHILFIPLVCLTATYFFRCVLQAEHVGQRGNGSLRNIPGAAT